MKEKFDKFSTWVLNQGIEISDKTNVYQCMDLAYSWVFFLNFPKSTIQHLYAYEVFTAPNSTTLKYFEVIKNSATFVPQVGDLAVFDKTANNIAGHISICTGTGNTLRFTSLDQNWLGVGRATLVEHNYDNPKLLGVLRPKLQGVQTSEVVSAVDLTSLDNSTAMKEVYGVIDIPTLKSKLIAKDQKIFDLISQARVVPEPVVEATSSASGSVTDSDKIEVNKSLLSQLVDLVARIIGKHE